MYNFIADNMAGIVAVALLAAFVGCVVYWNIADEREQKRLNNVKPLHLTCDLDHTRTNQELTNKAVDVVMTTSLNIAELFLKAALAKTPTAK
jgi:hypothetical protein